MSLANPNTLCGLTDFQLFDDEKSFQWRKKKKAHGGKDFPGNTAVMGEVRC